MLETFENDKYEIEVNDADGRVRLLRHGEYWVEDPQAPKMLIAIAYEMQSLRAEVASLKEDLQRAIKQRDMWDKANSEAREQLAAANAKIDALMLEYCPDEMTQEQVENWAKHQQVVQVCPECDIAGCRHVRAALSNLNEDSAG